jgi:hypothetical protein
MMRSDNGINEYNAIIVFLFKNNGSDINYAQRYEIIDTFDSQN